MTTGNSLRRAYLGALICKTSRVLKSTRGISNSNSGQCHRLIKRHSKATINIDTNMAIGSWPIKTVAHARLATVSSPSHSTAKVTSIPIKKTGLRGVNIAVILISSRAGINNKLKRGTKNRFTKGLTKLILPVPMAITGNTNKDKAAWAANNGMIRCRQPWLEDPYHTKPKARTAV